MHSSARMQLQSNSLIFIIKENSSLGCRAFQNRAATLSLGKPSPEGAEFVTHTCIREICQQLEQNCNTICSAVSFSAILSILTAPSHLSVKDVLLLWSQRFSRWYRTTVNILKLIKNSTVPLLPLGACSDLRRLHFDAFPGRNAFVVLSFNLQIFYTVPLAVVSLLVLVHVDLCSNLSFLPFLGL